MPRYGTKCALDDLGHFRNRILSVNSSASRDNDVVILRCMQQDAFQSHLIIQLAVEAICKPRSADIHGGEVDALTNAHNVLRIR